MNSSGVSTKKQIVSLIEDIDCITRQLLETLTQQSVKQKISAPFENNTVVSMDVGQLTEILLQKHGKLANLTAVAKEQQVTGIKIIRAKAEMEILNTEINCLQKHLKNAENLLANSLYQAKEKLKLHEKANTKNVLSEDIIKYAHKISASCCTAAPLNWTPGDVRRPYPQNIEMRCGFLGQLSNLNTMLDGEPPLKPPAQLGTEGIQLSNFMNFDNQWEQQDKMNNLSINLDAKDETEIMSSDSSSSDSSDSSFAND